MEIINLLCGIIGVILGFLSFFGISFFKKRSTLKLYSPDAEKKYNSQKDNVPKENMFEPYVYGGGNRRTPQYEESKIAYDPDYMGIEWKGCKKVARYYYKENGKIMVHGWRIK